MPTLRAALIWAAFAALTLGPLVVAATSPLLAWRQPVYIAAGFAGVLGFGVLLLQPMLIGHGLPGVPRRFASQAHRWSGGLLVACVIGHVGGLYITSPPDVIDALLLRSPTSFSVWGVLAMWTVLGMAVLAFFRRRLRPQIWKKAHGVLAVVTAVATVIHVLLIDGTMGQISKVALCIAVLLAVVWALRERRTFPALGGG